METPYYTASTYAMLLLRESGLAPAEVLAGTGLVASDLGRRDYVGLVEIATMLRNIDCALGDPAWAARMGAVLSVNTHGPLGFAALSAPTLGAALRVLLDFYPVRLNSIAAQLERVGNRYLFRVRDLSGDEYYSRWAAQVVLKVVASLVETIVGHPVGDNVRFDFEFVVADEGAAIEQMFGAHCVFGAAQTGVSIPASWWDIRSPLYDEDAYRSNVAKCREIIAARAGPSDPAEHIRHILARHFEQVLAGTREANCPPGLEQFAAGLYLSPRTLIRRLAERGTSYRELLEASRREYACKLLGQARLTVAEVGYKLGYVEPANFGRAFRRWYGISPAQWRRGK